MKNNKNNTITISDFLSTEYKDFSIYTIEHRALPSLVDGFKPSQRKIIHISSNVWKNGNEKTKKIFQLSGLVADQAFYHHGSCLDINTNILLQDGTYISLKDWVENYPDIKFDVVSYDEVNKIFTSSTGHSPRIGNITDVEFEIEMEDGSIIKCTDNHPFLTKRGWVEAKDLLDNDDIISIHP